MTQSDSTDTCPTKDEVYEQLGTVEFVVFASGDGDAILTAYVKTTKKGKMKLKTLPMWLVNS